MLPLVTCISSMATRGFLAEAAGLWQGSGRQDIRIESVGGVDARKRLLSGEAIDIAVLDSESIGQLAEAGRVVRETATELVRSHVAIAVPSNAPRPPIHDRHALREALLSAQSVAYSTGPSGRALQQLFADWGMAESIQQRAVRPPPGVPVAQLLADGVASLGFQQLSELMEIDGVHVIGPMPPGLEIVTAFVGAVCTASNDYEASLSLLNFLASAALDDARARHGLQPPCPTTSPSGKSS
jgi:molybdate transport system substrate-binding protein